MTGGNDSNCLGRGRAWSMGRSPDSACSDKAWAPSVLSEVSPIVGTKSSSREVAASSLPSMVSASFVGRVEGILGGVN